MPDHYQNPCKKGAAMFFGHLGGTCLGGDPDTWYPELWCYLLTSFKIKSMLDIGCGLGYAMKFFHDEGIDVTGIEGSAEIVAHHLLPNDTILHDFTNGGLIVHEKRDLIWSCEFLEHVEEQFVDGVIDTFIQAAGNVVAITAAPPGAAGHHHVNCQPSSYWIDKFCQAGLHYQTEMTKIAREIYSPPTGFGRTQSFFQRGGLIFTVEE